jgi:hypothetical protein
VSMLAALLSRTLSKVWLLKDGSTDEARAAAPATSAPEKEVPMSSGKPVLSGLSYLTGSPGAETSTQSP